MRTEEQVAEDFYAKHWDFHTDEEVSNLFREFYQIRHAAFQAEAKSLQVKTMLDCRWDNGISLAAFAALQMKPVQFLYVQNEGPFPMVCTSRVLLTDEEWASIHVGYSSDQYRKSLWEKKETEKMRDDLRANLIQKGDHWPFLDVTPVRPSSEGEFEAVRKHDIHTGIDLYAPDGSYVVAIEAGTVVGIIDFTGPSVGTPWWADTKAILVYGYSGTILYGEVSPLVKVGDYIDVGEILGCVKQVLLKDKGKPMSMLHLELYVGEQTTSCEAWEHGTRRPEGLCDPTVLVEKWLPKKTLGPNLGKHGENLLPCFYPSGLPVHVPASGLTSSSVPLCLIDPVFQNLAKLGERVGQCRSSHT